MFYVQSFGWSVDEFVFTSIVRWWFQKIVTVGGYIFIEWSAVFIVIPKFFRFFPTIFPNENNKIHRNKNSNKKISFSRKNNFRFYSWNLIFSHENKFNNSRLNWRTIHNKLTRQNKCDYSQLIETIVRRWSGERESNRLKCNYETVLFCVCVSRSKWMRRKSA